MKKCTLCGKEVQDDFEGVCPECGGKITAEEKKESAPVKSAVKKKLTAIIAAVIAVVLIAGVGVFVATNNKNSETPVSQTDDENKNKDAKEEEISPDSSKATESTEKETVPSDKKVSPDETADNSSSSESEVGALLPEDFKMEDMEKLIDEFNTTTDEKRKEELRLILEAIFSQAEELTVG